MKLRKYKIIALVMAILIFPSFAYAEIYDEGSTEAGIDMQVNLIVEGCNNNSVCEAIIGENTATCPLDCPEIIIEVPTTTEENGGGSSTVSPKQKIETKNLIEFSTFSDISILFKTNLRTVASIKIGKTSDYELTSAIENSFRENHFFIFNNLEPNTEYFYEITLRDKNYLIKTFQGKILTKTFLDSVIDQSILRLQNPTNLKTTTANGIVTLSWQNPYSEDFDYVRVIRTKEKETVSHLSGELIYEGRANLINDTNVTLGNKYYYTLFARYKNNDYSDGVYISAIVDSDLVLEKQKQEHKIEYGNENLSILYFSFLQNNEPLEKDQGLMIADSQNPIVIRLKKKDFFGPVEDVFIELNFYNREGNPFYKNIYRLDYKPAIASYETVINEIQPEQLINFIAYKIDKDKNMEQISGSIKVGPYDHLDDSFKLDEVINSEVIKDYFFVFFIIIFILFFALFRLLIRII